MRIAIISPYSTGAMRGNITTVRRIAQALDEAGAEIIVLPMDVFHAEEMARQLRAFSPDIIHAFHAYYCGETACTQAEHLDIPCVVTITGSDINEPRFRVHASTVQAMARAAAVVCFDDAAADQVARDYPATKGRLAVIPQGVSPLAGGAPPALPDDAFVLLLPAALRPVKNVEFPLRVLAPLTRVIDKLLLVIAGGVINLDYAGAIRKMLCGAPFARWLGEVPYEQMGALYARADLVLNCSRFEGMPNSLLEAMVLARPVLAVDIPGNRSLVHDNRTGWLYRDEADFKGLVVRLANDPALREQVGGRARDYVLENFPPWVEVGRYLKLYETVRRNFS